MPRRPDEFANTYRRLAASVMLEIEREVFGANVGVNGYTTIAQADGLASHLELHPGRRLLDVGSGQGWPGLYLARKTGCATLVTDVPTPAVRKALSLARRQRLDRRCGFAIASGTHLPIRPSTFDAVVHTDVL